MFGVFLNIKGLAIHYVIVCITVDTVNFSDNATVPNSCSCLIENSVVSCCKWQIDCYVLSSFYYKFHNCLALHLCWYDYFEGDNY